MEEKVSNLYNKLFEIERKTKRLRLYPIHKKLSLPNDKDIYDYLIEKFKIVHSISVLDAGCGVGYGSIKISKETDAQVMGISISPLEIQQANKNIAEHHSKNCSFKVSSFEDVPKNTYDIIICVESLKHAIPIDTAIRCLMSGLKPNGRLVIVDDFYSNDNILGKAEQHLIEYWRLDKLIEVGDLPKRNLIDITNYVKIKSMLSSRIKLLVLDLLKPFASQISIGLFRGGVYLDILYKQKKMKYLICEIRKENY